MDPHGKDTPGGATCPATSPPLDAFWGGGYADEPLKKGSHRVLPGFRRSHFAQARLPSLLSILGEGPDLLTWDGA